MNTINVQIDIPYQIDLSTARLIKVAQSALQTCNVVAAEMTIVITSVEAVQKLNRTYRGVDAPTDVLSFETEPQDDEFVAGNEPGNYLGDIIIAGTVAHQQAEAAGHSPADEMLLLAIHGILHLLGYDHHTPEEKTAMWRKQEEILRLNKLSHVKPTET